MAHTLESIRDEVPHVVGLYDDMFEAEQNLVTEMEAAHNAVMYDEDYSVPRSFAKVLRKYFIPQSIEESPRYFEHYLNLVKKKKDGYRKTQERYIDDVRSAIVRLIFRERVKTYSNAQGLPWPELPAEGRAVDHVTSHFGDVKLLVSANGREAIFNDDVFDFGFSRRLRSLIQRQLDPSSARFERIYVVSIPRVHVEIMRRGYDNSISIMPGTPDESDEALHARPRMRLHTTHEIGSQYTGFEVHPINRNQLSHVRPPHIVVAHPFLEDVEGIPWNASPRTSFDPEDVILSLDRYEAWDPFKGR